MVVQSQFIEMFGNNETNPRGFMRKPISEVSTLINGRAYSAKELLQSGKYRVLRVGNFFSTSDFYYSDLELEPNKYCEKGDLLYAWSATFGARIWEEERVIYHYHIWKVEYDNKLLDKEFLCFLLNEMTENLKSDTHGSTMMHLTKEGMERKQIIIPPIGNQNSFVSLLHQADKSKFDSPKSQFIEMFGESFSSNETIHLSEMVQEDRPITYGVIKPGDFVEEGVVLVRVKDIVDGKILLTDLRRITSAVAQNYLRSTLSPGDILLSIRGTIGRTAIVTEELDGANITQDTARISLKEEYNNHFIKSVLDSPVIQDWIQLHVKGLAVKGINLEDVRRIPIPTVKNELQEIYITLYHQADKSKYLS